MGKRDIGRREVLKTGSAVAFGGMAARTSDRLRNRSLSGINQITQSSRGKSPKRGNEWWAHHGMTSSEYKRKFSKYVDQNGLRLVDLSGYGVDGEERYAAIWADVAGPNWIVDTGLSASQFQKKFERYSNNGFRPTNLCVYSVSGSPKFAVTWAQYDGPDWYLYNGLSFEEYRRRFNSLLDRGYLPTEITGYTEDRNTYYAAIWQRFDGPEWYSHHGMSGSEYQRRFDEYVNQGLRVTDISGFEVNGEPRYNATWQNFGGPEWYSHHGLTSSEFQNTFEDYVDRGFRLINISGYTIDGEPRFMGIWRREKGRQPGFGDINSTVSSYMQKYDIPGLSLAITKDERLVFSKGYGYANRESQTRMQPKHQLRIASISKPITGVAILSLVEEGDIALSDQVFGARGILDRKYGTPTHEYTADGSTTNITVHHLLQHSSGWTNRGGTFDPMFELPSKNQAELIQWMLDNIPLKYEPGTSNTYLNFGYCLLGRVIEAVSGKPYDRYVQDAVLKPAGISDMIIAGDTRSDRRTDEAVYYGENPYALPVSRMDSHGGWIATPTDLLRLSVRVDGFPKKPDILRPATLDELSDLEGNRRRYGEGWKLRSDWRGHNGSFPGTIGFLVRRDDGISYAVIANTRPEDDPYAQKAQKRLDGWIREIEDWPTTDLFESVE